MAELSWSSDQRHMQVLTCVGIIEIQWWQTWTLAWINEKVKVRTKYTLMTYSLEIAPISVHVCVCPFVCPFFLLLVSLEYHKASKIVKLS